MAKQEEGRDGRPLQQFSLEQVVDRQQVGIQMRLTDYLIAKLH